MRINQLLLRKSTKIKSISSNFDLIFHIIHKIMKNLSNMKSYESCLFEYYYLYEPYAKTYDKFENKDR